MTLPKQGRAEPDVMYHARLQKAEQEKVSREQKRRGVRCQTGRRARERRERGAGSPGDQPTLALVTPSEMALVPVTLDVASLLPPPLPLPLPSPPLPQMGPPAVAPLPLSGHVALIRSTVECSSRASTNGADVRRRSVVPVFHHVAILSITCWSRQVTV